MLSGFIARWVAPYALAGLATLLGLSLLALGVQSYRLKSLQGRAATEALQASESARAEYERLAVALDVAAGQLLTTQQERDDALSKTGRKVTEYIRRPAAAVQCLDADGLQLVADLARGTATDPGAPAGKVPERATGAD